MLRGLDGFFDARLASSGQRCGFQGPPGGLRSRTLSVAIARGKHLFPFRTEQLSLSAPMVLGPQGPGRVGRRRFNRRKAAPRGGLSSFWGSVVARRGASLLGRAVPLRRRASLVG